MGAIPSVLWRNVDTPHPKIIISTAQPEAITIRCFQIGNLARPGKGVDAIGKLNRTIVARPCPPHM